MTPCNLKITRVGKKSQDFFLEMIHITWSIAVSLGQHFGRSCRSPVLTVSKIVKFDPVDQVKV